MTRLNTPFPDVKKAITTDGIKNTAERTELLL